VPSSGISGMTLNEVALIAILSTKLLTVCPVGPWKIRFFSFLKMFYLKVVYMHVWIKDIEHFRQILSKHLCCIW
jgi:hypothetical protein